MALRYSVACRLPWLVVNLHVCKRQMCLLLPPGFGGASTGLPAEEAVPPTRARPVPKVSVGSSQLSVLEQLVPLVVRWQC